jgi:rhodanese-related sulfurtransferase
MLQRIVVALALVAGLGCASAAKPDFGELTVDQVQAKLSDKSVFVFDCNSPSDFAAGHVPHAKWVAYDNLQAKDLPADKNATLIFYCANPH